MKKILVLIILLPSLTSCYRTRDYIELSKQTSLDGLYDLYYYHRYGLMAFSSDVVGLEIYKKGRKFREGNGFKLPTGIFGKWISNDSLLLYQFDMTSAQPKDTLPNKVEYVYYKNLKIKIEHYRINSTGLDFYIFDSLMTDSRFLYLNRTDDDKGQNQLKFPLGPITIKTINDTLSNIEIVVLKKDMDFFYKEQNGNTLTGLPGVGVVVYQCTPSRKIYSKLI